MYFLLGLIWINVEGKQSKKKTKWQGQLWGKHSWRRALKEWGGHAWCRKCTVSSELPEIPLTLCLLPSFIRKQWEQNWLAKMVLLISVLENLPLFYCLTHSYKNLNLRNLSFWKVSGRPSPKDYFYTSTFWFSLFCLLWEWMSSCFWFLFQLTDLC